MSGQDAMSDFFTDPRVTMAKARAAGIKTGPSSSSSSLVSDIKKQLPRPIPVPKPRPSSSASVPPTRPPSAPPNLVHRPRPSSEGPIRKRKEARRPDPDAPDTLLKAKLKNGRPPSSPPSSSADASDSEAEPRRVKRLKAEEDVLVEREGSAHAMTPHQRRVERFIARPVSPKPPSEPNDAELVSSFDLVTSNRKAYKQWFRDPHLSNGLFPEDGSDPVVELEYPGDARERFVLVVPRIDDDEYRPLVDLMNVIRTVLGHFLTSEQCRTHFAESHPIGASSGSAFSFLSAPPQRSSRSPSLAPPVASSSRGTTPNSLLVAPAVSQDEPSPMPEPDDSPDLSQYPLIHNLDKARRRQDGPRFVAFIEHYNRVISLLRSSGALRANVGAMPGLRLQVWDTILRQAYERRVGPRIEELGKYESWSDNVYGELRPPFVSDILHLTHVGPSDVVVDLGSGVGNCVVQAALESGCTAVGFENMKTASDLASGQRAEIASRARRMWAVDPGESHVFEADFTADARVSTWLQKADVVIVNNQVFTPSLNEKLSWLFLDLRDGTRIVSLKPFVPADFRLNARTADSPHAVLDQGPLRMYAKNSVSWTGEGGTFFIAKVDRSRVEKYIGGLGR